MAWPQLRAGIDFFLECVQNMVDDDPVSREAELRDQFCTPTSMRAADTPIASLQVLFGELVSETQSEGIKLEDEGLAYLHRRKFSVQERRLEMFGTAACGGNVIDEDAKKEAFRLR